jgi:hypothetical protein
MRERRTPFISPVTVSRRSVLEWIGKASGIALGAPLLAACERAMQSASIDRGSGSDGGDSGADGGAPAPTECGDGAAVPFAFQPGADDGPLFANWYENTVDPMDLAQILASWTLRVDGMCAAPRTFSFRDLLCAPRVDEVMDFHCVEGWDVLDVPWSGVHMSTLFDLVQPTAAATHITIHTFTPIYTESLPLSVALEPHTLLAYGVAGATLPMSHGFPLRVVIPRLLGYKNAKHVSRIELTDHLLDGYWEGTGYYPYDAPVPPARLRPGKY